MKVSFFENPFWNTLTRIADLLILNVLWVLCSLPVITIGASTTALYYCMLKLVREEERGIAAMFFSSFWKNFKQGCLLTVLVILSGLFIAVDIRVCMILDSVVCKILLPVFPIALIFWVLMVSYLFPLLAQFDNTMKAFIKNSLLVSLTNFRYTLFIVIRNLIPAAMFVFLPEAFVMTTPLWIAIGVSLIAYFNAKDFVKVFDKYIDSDVVS